MESLRMNFANKKIIIISVQLIIVLFFILGAKTEGSFRILYYSYYADIFIPFGLYFLLILGEEKHTFLRSWKNKALIVFTVVSISEILQYFGVFALARIFDPMDFVMYGIGVLSAAFIEKKLFSGVFDFWE